MSEQEARKYAFNEFFVWNPLKAAAGGFISGGVFATGANAVSDMRGGTNSDIDSKKIIENNKGKGTSESVGKTAKYVGFYEEIITDGSQLQDGKLKPSVTYKTEEYDYIYRTNEDGLITNASTEYLQFKTHDGRLNHNPKTYGKVKGDQAGHLFGDRFGGSPELDNLISQAQKVNQSEFKVIENQWSNALRNGQQVTVDITINYEKGNLRPISFDVYYTIDGIPFLTSITN